MRALTLVALLFFAAAAIAGEADDAALLTVTVKALVRPGERALVADVVDFGRALPKLAIEHERIDGARFARAAEDPAELGENGVAIGLVHQESVKEGRATVQFNRIRRLLRGVRRDNGTVSLMKSEGAWQVTGVKVHHFELGAGANAMRVGGLVRAPQLVTKVEPEYTDEARLQRIQGVVILEAIIDREGNVAEVSVMKPLAFGLSDRAIEAAKQWKFKPATLEGKPVDVIFFLTLNFRLE